MHLRSLLIRLDGITAGDYLTWVRDPEPLALQNGLLSVVISAEPLGELVNIEFVWAVQPPTTPGDVAVAAGFALTPEVVEIHTAGYVPRRRCKPPQAERKEVTECPYSTASGSSLNR